MKAQTWKSRCFVFLAGWILWLIAGCGERAQSDRAEPGMSSSTSISPPVSVVPPPIQRIEPIQTIEPLPSGVALHLSFDIGTICKKGKQHYVKDLSGNGHYGFIRNVTPAKGKFGAAVNFTGKSASKVSGPDASLPSGSAPSTISLWFSTRTIYYNFLFTYGTPAANQLRGLAIFQPNTLSFFRWEYDALDVGHLPFTTNEWHHFVASYDGEKAAIYLDGEKKGEKAFQTKTVLSQYLLGKSYEQRGYFDGLIDELIVFNRALSDGEIKALYNRKEYSELGELSYESAPQCDQTGS